MKMKFKMRRKRGLSLVELLTVLMIIGLIAALSIPHLGSLTGVADDVKDKRNAQTILLSYTTGAAAGIQWPAGDVAVKVTAVLAGQKPPTGVFADTWFRANVPADEVDGTYRFLGKRASGELFFDPSGGQNATGH
jgi:prepilin-type N-terminal cleavage/methylation domain-containing protein